MEQQQIAQGHLNVIKVLSPSHHDLSPVVTSQVAMTTTTCLTVHDVTSQVPNDVICHMIRHVVPPVSVRCEGGDCLLGV